MWFLTAREYVGSLVVDGMRILIRPKIRLENLFLLLEVGLPEQAWRKEDFGYATHHDLLRSLVAFFARTLRDDTCPRSIPLLPDSERGPEGDQGPGRLRTGNCPGPGCPCRSLAGTGSSPPMSWRTVG